MVYSELSANSPKPTHQHFEYQSLLINFPDPSFLVIRYSSLRRFSSARMFLLQRRPLSVQALPKLSFIAAATALLLKIFLNGWHKKFYKLKLKLNHNATFCEYCLSQILHHPTMKLLDVTFRYDCIGFVLLLIITLIH